jgi:thioredoxin
MRKLPNILLAACFTIFSIACSNGQQGITKLGPSEFKTEYESDKNGVLLDVRTPSEYSGGHISKSLNIDWNSDNAETMLKSLDPNKTYYVYCLSGGRSASAVNFMKEAGFKDIVELKGGIMKWRASNLPEEKGEANRVSNSSNTSNTNLTLEQFNALTKSDKIVVVDIYAEWCAPCKKMAPYLADMKKNMSDKVEIIKIDADKNTELCKQLGVDALPTIYVYKKNTRTFTHVGFLSREDLEKQL